jgi:prolipoprotein diacylglyceryltransferase
VNAYEGLWTAGLTLGAVAADDVLRRRGVTTAAARAAIPVAVLALVWGATVQHRLLFAPLSEAFRVSPAAVLGPGRSLPLGLAVGVLAGMGWAAAVGARWRTVGDALAVGFTALQPVGRLGCLVAGCCTGLLCEGPWCMRFGPESVAHGWHVDEGWIGRDAALSLPVHPLPLYFAAASLALLALLLLLFRRDAAPGTILLVWAVLDPLSRLGLEQLRGGAPSRTATLTETLLVWLAADAAVLLVVAWRSRQAAGRAFARATWPSQRALGFGARAWVSRSTATRPKVGR